MSSLKKSEVLALFSLSILSNFGIMVALNKLVVSAVKSVACSNFIVYHKSE